MSYCPAHLKNIPIINTLVDIYPIDNIFCISLHSYTPINVSLSDSSTFTRIYIHKNLSPSTRYNSIDDHLWQISLFLNTHQSHITHWQPNLQITDVQIPSHWNFFTLKIPVEHKFSPTGEYLIDSLHWHISPFLNTSQYIPHWWALNRYKFLVYRYRFIGILVSNPGYNIPHS